jgi:NADPH-dependent F420 reductase
MADRTTIGIIGGTGRHGRGIALRFALAGAALTIGSRKPERAWETAAHLHQSHPTTRIEGASNYDAIRVSDVVILAVPYAHIEPVLSGVRDAFKPGTLLIDVTVPLTFENGEPRFMEPPEASAAEHVRRIAPDHVALAGALKTVPAALLQDTSVPLACDDFICGDAKSTRDRAMALVGLIPALRPVDAGPLEAARVLERMTLLAIGLNRRYKSGNARFQVVGI